MASKKAEYADYATDDEIKEAEDDMSREWIKEQAKQQQGKPWPKWMFAADKNEPNTTME